MQRDTPSAEVVNFKFCVCVDAARNVEVHHRCKIILNYPDFLQMDFGGFETRNDS